MKSADQFTRSQKIAYGLTNYFAGTVLIVAAILFLGLHLDFPWIVQISTGMAPVQYNAVVGLLVSGLGLAALNHKDKRAWASVCGFLVFLLGAMTLVQYVLVIDCGIDELFFKHKIVTKTSHAGRMSINSAINFMVIGLALIVPRIRFTRWIGGDFVGLISSVMSAIALVTLFGYLLDVPSAIGWWNHTQMAPQTALTFLVLGAGFFCWGLAQKPFCSEVYWLPHATGLLLMVLSLILWNGMRLERRDRHVPVLPERGTRFLVASRQTILPEVVLSVSVMLSLSLAFLTRLLQQARIREIQMSATVLDLREARDKLKVALQNLEEFSFVISHDMKAPLRGIGSMVTGIKENHGDKMDAQTRECLESIEERIERMRGMIDGVLECARTTQVMTAKEDVNMTELVHEVMSLLPKPHHAIILISDEMPLLRVARVQLEQVFQNLIGNALKFVDRPGGTIKICCQEDGPRWLFSVHDNGPGIAPQYHTRIFDIFQGVPGQTVAGGTGIGLTIVKKIVDLSGGKIWIESEEGKSCSFYFTLPKDSGLKNQKPVCAA